MWLIVQAILYLKIRKVVLDFIYTNNIMITVVFVLFKNKKCSAQRIMKILVNHSEKVVEHIQLKLK